MFEAFSGRRQFAAAADMIVANDGLLRDFTAQGLAATRTAMAR